MSFFEHFVFSQRKSIFFTVGTVGRSMSTTVSVRIDPNTLQKGEIVIIEDIGQPRWSRDIAFEITDAMLIPHGKGSDIRLQFKAVTLKGVKIKRGLASDLSLPTYGRGSEFKFFKHEVMQSHRLNNPSALTNYLSSVSGIAGKHART